MTYNAPSDEADLPSREFALLRHELTVSYAITTVTGRRYQKRETEDRQFVELLQSYALD